VLNAALSAANEGGEGEVVRQRVQELLQGRKGPTTISEHVVHGSMLLLVGLNPGHPSRKARKDPWEGHAADVAGLSWLAWASNNHEMAVDGIQRFRARQKRSESSSSKTGSVHLLTLSFWNECTLNLVKGDRHAAKKYLRRALDLGGFYATESHPTISWAYAASFFNERPHAPLRLA
jgi:hypothetical protein